MASLRPVFQQAHANTPVHLSSPPEVAPQMLSFRDRKRSTTKAYDSLVSGNRRKLAALCRVSPETASNIPEAEDGGVSLGTMKLPVNTDLIRFEALLFQWANSLCQGAYLPLPVPLKVDKIVGGARLGFITIEDDGKTRALVYIDCFVSAPTASGATGSGPIFRAVRNGPKRDESPPGEPRIMKSLLSALKKAADIATL